MKGGTVFRPFLTAGTAVLVVLMAAMVDPASAQNRPGPAVELTAGWVGFADDGIVSESLIGGTARLHLLPRISVGPEVAYIRGNNHSHLVLTGNLTCDLLSPTNARGRPVNPFIVVGGGLFQTREQFPSGTYTSGEGAFTAGGGVRALVANRVTAGVDVRIGWELHVRVNGFMGLQFGR